MPAPKSGTGTTQKCNHDYLHFMMDKYRERRSVALAEGRHETRDSVVHWDRKLTHLPKLYLCQDGVGTPGTLVSYLMLKSRAEAEQCDPQQLAKWEQAQRSPCIVTKYSDPLFFVCDSPSHSDHQSQAVGDADKGTTHSNFMAGNWGCYKCSQSEKRLTLEHVQGRLNAFGFVKYKITAYQDSHKFAKVTCPDHGLFEILADNILYNSMGKSPCPDCKVVMRTRTSAEEQRVIRVVALFLGISPDAITAAPGAVSNEIARQVRIGEFYVDALIKLVADNKVGAAVQKLVVESNGALFHGDSRLPQFNGSKFFDKASFEGKSARELSLRTVTRRLELVASDCIVVEVWPLEGIKDMSRLVRGVARNELSERMQKLLKDDPGAGTMICNAYEGLDSPAWGAAVSKHCRKNITMAETVAHLGRLSSIFEPMEVVGAQSESFVIRNIEEGLLSYAGAPAPLNEVQNLDDDVTDLVLPMGEEYAADIFDLQSDFKAAKRRVLASMGRIAPALAVTGAVHAVLDSTKPCSPEVQPPAVEASSGKPADILRSLGACAVPNGAAATSPDVQGDIIFGTRVAADDDAAAAAAAAEAMEHGDTYFLGGLPLAKGSGAGGKAQLLQALMDENIEPDVPGFPKLVPGLNEVVKEAVEAIGGCSSTGTDISQHPPSNLPSCLSGVAPGGAHSSASGAATAQAAVPKSPAKRSPSKLPPAKMRRKLAVPASCDKAIAARALQPAAVQQQVLAEGAGAAAAAAPTQGASLTLRRTKINEKSALERTGPATTLSYQEIKQWLPSPPIGLTHDSVRGVMVGTQPVAALTSGELWGLVLAVGACSWCKSYTRNFLEKKLKEFVLKRKREEGATKAG